MPNPSRNIVEAAAQESSPFASVTGPWLRRLFADRGWDGPLQFVFLRSDENRVVRVRAQDGREVVAKFYRPGRRSVASLREQHAFLDALHTRAFPVIRPVALDIHDGIDYAVYASIEGSDRIAPQYTLADLHLVGRLLGELHAAGRQRDARHARVVAPACLGEASLDYLLAREIIPNSVRDDVVRAAKAVIARIADLTSGFPMQLIHGDFGPWNIRWSAAGPVLLDFDDMAHGLAIQDVALFCNDITKSHDNAEAISRRDAFLDGYRECGMLPAQILALLEPFRSLRTLHVAAWAVSLWSEAGVRQRHADVMTHAGWEWRLEEFGRAVR